MSYKIYLKKNEEKRIIGGHAWVYANEVSHIEGKDKNGSLANVYTYNNIFIGKGYINHLSKILVRIFIRDENIVDDEELFLNRIIEANNYRKLLGYDNNYRMVFAEADNLPGLVIDKYDNVLVLQTMTLGMELKKNTIIDVLTNLFNPICIYERNDNATRLKEGLKESSGILYGTLPSEIIINENGIKMKVDIVNGQKTGYFLDQKENRLAARKYFNCESVLDCFCNCGGFSLNAAPYAQNIIAADISQYALDIVKYNAILNGFTNIKTECHDVFELLRKYKNENIKFDTIILDPPAFCKSVSEVNDALRGYKDINILAMKCIKNGGFLISSSCTHFITHIMFEKMLIEAAHQSGKIVRCVEIKSQAPDHPSLLCAEETQYLKFFVLQIFDKY